MKYLCTTLLFFFLSLSHSITHAVEIRFGGWSKHLGTDEYTNESHTAFVIEYINFSAGYFKNSFDSDTFSTALNKSWTFHNKTKIRLNAGLMYGYRDCFLMNKENQRKSRRQKLCPLFYPEVRWDTFLNPGFGLLGNAAVVTFGIKL